MFYFPPVNRPHGSLGRSSCDGPGTGPGGEGGDAAVPESSREQQHRTPSGRCSVIDSCCSVDDR